MKLSVLVIAILVTTCIFTGCSKGNKDSPTPTSMTSTINGSNFSVSSCLFGYNSDTLIIAGGNVNPQNHNAIQLLDPYIALYINNYAGSPGTFTIGSTASVFIDSNRASGYRIAGSTGTITITKSSTTNITGTFNFTCTDGSTVVNGMFTAKRN